MYLQKQVEQNVMTHYPHLEGLRRLSPCCQKRVAHFTGWDDMHALALKCLGCGHVVTHFLLRNRHGQIVWPIAGNQPPAPPKPRRKRRRAHPTEPDPAPYTLHLDRRVLDSLLK